MTMMWTTVFLALLAFVTSALALNVSRGRIVHRIPHGEGPKGELSRAIRAHANSVEHLVPIGFLLLGYALLAGNETVVIVHGAVTLAARLFLSIGILRKGFFGVRRLGALLTYLVEASLTVLVLLAAAQRFGEAG